MRNMKLLVQARKDGYNVLYPKPTPSEFFQFAGDIRPENKDPNLLGKYLYTISFANGGCIFTKHVIVQDVQRQGLGNIGFSIFIPNNKKLSGNDSIKLLDELLNTYCENYCPDYYLENKKEDWKIFETIKNNYELKDLSYDAIENYQRGNAEAAFVYYIDKTELCKFFDNPYQDEFSTYKQVFFVEKNLENKSDNPLNAIAHDPSANLTGKIDSENLQYKLIYKQQAESGLKIEVIVNDKPLKSKNKIKIKDEIKITWSKEFYKTIEKSGKCDEIESKFIIINDFEKTITVKKIELEEIVYTITIITKIQTKDNKSKDITDAKITLKVGDKTIRPESDSIRVTEKDLQNKCYIIAEKDKFSPQKHEITQEDVEKGSLTLILHEHKEVEFIVKDEKGHLVSNYSIQIPNKEIQPKDGKVEFKGKEIYETWKIIVSHRDYEPEEFNYCPANDENPKHINLKKKSFSSQVQSPQNENEFPTNNDNSYLRYSKVPKFAWIIGITAIVALIIVILLVNTDGSDNKASIVNAEINNKNFYIYGIELNLDTLKEYKRRYCDSNTIIQSDAKEKSFWEKIKWLIFWNDEDSNSTNESSLIPDFCSKIDTAIAILNAINLGKIDELKGQMFSETQQNFKNSTDSIEDKYKKQNGDTLLNACKDSVTNLKEDTDLKLKPQNDLREKEKLKQKEKENETEKQQTNENSLEREFWALVNSGNAEMDSYLNLLNKHKSKGGDIIEYLNKICKNSASFQKFKNIPEMDRKNAKTLKDIEIE